MDASTSVGKLLAALKQQLKARRLNYRTVASRMKVSEATVKRYFSGKAVTVDILEKLAAIVQLDLLSLVILAQQQSTIEGGVNKPQLAALKRDKWAHGVFFMLFTGWSPAQISQEFDLGHQIDSILTKLETLGFIRRLSPESVKILVKPDVRGKIYGQMAESAIEYAREFLAEINLTDEKGEWILYNARLSAASLRQVRELIKRFDSDVKALSKNDIILPRDETQWYRIFATTQPVSRKRLLRQG